MKVYIIEVGEYSDKSICAVASDEETAKKLKIIYSDEDDEARISEFDTDDEEVDGDFKTTYWSVEIWKNNANEVRFYAYPFINAPREGLYFDYDEDDETCNAVVRASSEEQALKIVHDKIAKSKSLRNELESLKGGFTNDKIN